MKRTRYPKAWLDLELCLEHGTWFDKGELLQVASAAKRVCQDWRNARQGPRVGAPPALQPILTDMTPHDHGGIYMRGLSRLLSAAGSTSYDDDYVDDGLLLDFIFSSDDSWD